MTTEALNLEINQQQTISEKFANIAENLKHNFSRIVGAVALVAASTAGMVIEDVIHATPVAAETGGYPYADAPCYPRRTEKDPVNGACAGFDWRVPTKDPNGNITSWPQYTSRGFTARNCTDWAAFRAQQATGILVPYGAKMGNATDWDSNGKAAGYTVTSVPEEGDIAQNDNAADGTGHVGVVEEVDKDNSGKITSIRISQYNGVGTGMYSDPLYYADSNGKFWYASGEQWDDFIDLNGVGKGINGEAVQSTSETQYDDYVIYRPDGGTGYWYAKKGPDGTTTIPWVNGAQQGGWSQDVPVTGDFNGDGYDDFGIYRPINGTGYWYVRSGVNTGDMIVNGFVHGGQAGDIPVTGDFDGDGKADFGIYRVEGSAGHWYVKSSKTGNPTAIWGAVHGSPGDVPVAGDVNGDKIADFGVYRAVNGTASWYFKSGANGQPTPIWGAVHGGQAGDRPIVGDFNGDKIDDFGIYRPSNGTGYWYVKSSSNGQPIPKAWGVTQGGWPQDVPLAGNFG